jgi:hypothetical protein
MMRIRTIAGAAARTLLALVVLSTPAAAQSASITGVVRDASGAVLPGVTVDATSPVLIERVRTVVSDSTGQYRIVDLRPGVYAVTFTMAGFNTYIREGIELTGNFTATVSAELRLGALEESITVTGQAPAVDVQGVSRQQALSAEVIGAVPSGRNYTNLGVLVPGISSQCAQTCSTGAQDVGGLSGDSRATLTVHGSRFRDQRIAVNGMTIAGSTGGLTMTGPNMEAMQEVQLETSSADASTSTGGVRINVVPKDGGNTFSGSLFATGTQEKFQGDNFTQALQDRGLDEGGVPRLKTLYDAAPTFGGPLKQDRLWFFTSARVMNNVTYVGNLFENRNAYDPGRWHYEPDLTKQVTHDSPLHPFGARLTWQASERNKIAFSIDVRERCDCPNVAGGATAKEAATDFVFKPDNLLMVQWSSPATSRLLLEGTFVRLPLGWGNRTNEFIDPAFTQVTLQNAPPGVPGTYRGVGQFNWTDYPFQNAAFSTTYVTGAHAFKAGANLNWGYAFTTWESPTALTSVRINAATGLPNQFTVNSNPRTSHVKVDREVGLFFQDRWTASRLTLSGGVRYDYMQQSAPPVTLGPAPLLPDRQVIFPDTRIKGLSDISPRMGAAIDLFGTGTTAVKVALNRYVTDESLGSGTNTIIGSPQVYFQYTAARSWTDANGNFHPDCDWANGGVQDFRGSGGDFCGAFTGANANFGRSTPGTVADDDVLYGWGKRGYNWEFSTSLQQELVPGRAAIDFGYFRRWYGNFTVQDNLVTEVSDYSPFSVRVPDNPALPRSGQTIEGFLDVNPDKASLPTDNHVRLSKHYGEQYERWHGVDVITSARLGGGTVVQGGFSTGKTVQDNCAVLAKVPEAGVTTQQGLNNGLLPIAGSLATPFCHQETPFLTQVKLLGTYTIPGVDIQLAGTFQSIPGPQVAATLVVPNNDVVPSLNRNLSGSASNVTVNIMEAGSLYGDRLNQLDVRVGKIFRFAGNRRLTASVDIYNSLNSSAVLQESTEYSSFRTPERLVGARMFKFSAMLNF